MWVLSCKPLHLDRSEQDSQEQSVCNDRQQSYTDKLIFKEAGDCRTGLQVSLAASVRSLNPGGQALTLCPVQAKHCTRCFGYT